MRIRSLHLRYISIWCINKECLLLVGGDFTMALDPTLDVSKSASHLSYAKLCRAKRLLQELQLMDSWRTLHVQDRDYTFFLAKHRTYTRIYYIFFHRMLCHVYVRPL